MDLTFFGDLPLHPLVVHFAIVLVPLASLFFIIASLIPRASSKLMGFAALSLVVSLPFVFLAQQSGEALTEVYTTPTEHIENGELMLPVVGAAATLAVLAWLSMRLRFPSLVIAIVKLLGVGAAGAAIWFTVLTGHSGALATWGGVVAGETVEEVPAPAEDEPVVEEAPVEESAPPAGAAALTAEEVALRNTVDNCWVIIEGNVYDMTPFASRHPGGQSNIERLCGTDGTALFQGQHGGSSEPAAELEQLLLGPLE